MTGVLSLDKRVIYSVPSHDRVRQVVEDEVAFPRRESEDSVTFAITFFHDCHQEMAGVDPQIDQRLPFQECVVLAIALHRWK